MLACSAEYYDRALSVQNGCKLQLCDLCNNGQNSSVRMINPVDFKQLLWQGAFRIE